MLILGAGEVRSVLDGAEQYVLRAVREAYVLHTLGLTSVPHSAFLRFPDDERNRIIALPAYLGSHTPVAGVKWVSSFPGNVAAGVDRASAAIVLNSMRTGAPEVFLEGSAISARRTAASAALAAATLNSRYPQTGVSLIGCGLINFEVLTYLRTALPDLDVVVLHDLDRTRAWSFATRVSAAWPELKVEVADDVEEALSAQRLVSMATTAARPHLGGEHCQPGALVLHLSLRDLTAETILSSTNVVDDTDHVCRAATSLHLAEQEAGHRDFISTSLGEILAADTPYVRSEEGLTVFSPFGLGCLDLAVADLVRQAAESRGLGTEVPDFLPQGEQMFAQGSTSATGVGRLR